MTLGSPPLVGLIGGMSWESSAEYYRLMNTFTKHRHGGWHSARCLMYSVDFADVERMQAEGRWDEAGRLLANAARSLEAAGADLILLCTNTMHKVARYIEEAVAVPFLNLLDVTAAAIVADSITKVGLLATGYTMSDSFYRDHLARYGVEVVVPEERDRAEVHRIIYEELCLGLVKEESRETYVRIMRDLVAAGCEGIVLGCTEIELLVDQSHADMPIYPTTRMHVSAALDIVDGSGTDANLIKRAAEIEASKARIA